MTRRGSYFTKYTERNTGSQAKWGKQRNMFQIKDQEKASEKDLNEMEISNLSDKEFKVKVIKLTKLRSIMDEYSENFNR